MTTNVITVGPETHDQREIVRFLSSPAAYATHGPIEHHEAHGTHVFLMGERAYKLKRDVASLASACRTQPPYH